MNNWKIPDEMEFFIRDRDKFCAYCGVFFSNNTKPTWEHIINDENIITYENIVLCCRSCNSSKGARKLSEWLKSKYCKERLITEDTVSSIVKRALVKEKLT